MHTPMHREALWQHVINVCQALMSPACGSSCHAPINLIPPRVIWSVRVRQLTEAGSHTRWQLTAAGTWHAACGWWQVASEVQQQKEDANKSLHTLQRMRCNARVCFWKGGFTSAEADWVMPWLIACWPSNTLDIYAAVWVGYDERGMLIKYVYINKDILYLYYIWFISLICQLRPSRFSILIHSYLE